MRKRHVRCKIFGVDDALLGAGANFLGGIVNNLFAGSRQEDAQQFNLQSQAYQQQFNAAEAGNQRAWASQEAVNNWLRNTSAAEQARDWAKDMSSTTYQRTMADMRAAGLNPMLAYRQGGSGAPTGPAGSGSAASSSPASSGLTSVSPAQVFDIVGPAVSTATALQRLANETKLADAQVDQLRSQTETEKVRPESIRAETAKREVEYQHGKATLPKSVAEGVKGQIEADVFSSGAGKILYGAGLVGGSTAKAVAPITDVIGTFKSRWPRPGSGYD